MSQLIVNPSLDFHAIRASGGTWAASRDAEAGSSVADPYNVVWAWNVYYTTYTVYRGFIQFDVSAIPARAIIDSATLSFYIDAQYEAVAWSLYVLKATFGAAVAASFNDFEGWAASGPYSVINLIGSFDNVDVSEGSYNDIALNANGKNLIQEVLSGGKLLKLALLLNYDVTDVAPADAEFGARVQIQSAEGLNVPKLTINYTAQSGLSKRRNHIITGLY